MSLFRTPPGRLACAAALLCACSGKTGLTDSTPPAPEPTGQVVVWTSTTSLLPIDVYLANQLVGRVLQASTTAPTCSSDPGATFTSGVGTAPITATNPAGLQWAPRVVVSNGCTAVRLDRPSGESGVVVFWAGDSSSVPAVIRVNGTNVGAITTSSILAPACGSSSGVTIAMPIGRRPYTVIGSRSSFDTTVDVTADVCNAARVDRASPANCTAAPVSVSVIDGATADTATVSGNASFSRSWTLRNTGSCPWPTNLSVGWVSGPLSVSREAIPLGRAVAPNDTYAFTIAMRAPAAQATTQTYAEAWELRDASGSRVGDARFTTTIRVTGTAVPTCSAASGASVGFVSQSPPDSTEVAGDGDFTLTWTLRNTGGCVWPTTFSLQYVSGTLSSSRAPIPLATAVSPNATYSFTLRMHAPLAAPDKRYYTDVWEFRDASGAHIGNFTLYVIIAVPGTVPVACTAAPEAAAAFVTQSPLDSTRVAGNTAFTQTWTLRNTGRCIWPTGFTWSYVSGPMSTSHASIPLERAVAPNETYTFSVAMRTAPPATELQYERDTWELRDASGTRVGGSGVYVIIAVPGDPALLPGRVVIWTAQQSLAPVTVRVDGRVAGTITRAVSSPPACGSPDGVTLTAPPGLRPFTARNPAGIVWDYSVTVTPNACTTFRLDGLPAGQGGEVVFWAASSSLLPITVKLNDEPVGTITTARSAAPSCGTAGSVTVAMPAGNRRFTAENAAGLRWDDTINVAADRCTPWQLFASQAPPPPPTPAPPPPPPASGVVPDNMVWFSAQWGTTGELPTSRTVRTATRIDGVICPASNLVLQRRGGLLFVNTPGCNYPHLIFVCLTKGSATNQFFSQCSQDPLYTPDAAFRFSVYAGGGGGLGRPVPAGPLSIQGFYCSSRTAIVTSVAGDRKITCR